MERAIDKLCKAFSVDERSSYAIKDGEKLVLKVYWTPLTIADRDKINQTLQALKSGDQESGMDFAVQMLIQKAEDEAKASKEGKTGQSSNPNHSGKI